MIHVEKEIISCIRVVCPFESICNENNNPDQFMVGHFLKFGNQILILDSGTEISGKENWKLDI